MTRPLLLLAGLLALGGCVRDEAAPPADTPTTDTNPATPDAAPSDLPADQLGLNLQANHASGSVLRVTGVRFRDDHIAVDLTFTNGADFEQRLNEIDDFVLRDNLSNVYRLSPPPGNEDVRVQQGTTTEGEFVFLGRLNPQATALTLVTNERNGNTEDYARDPRFSIEIPFTRPAAP